MSHSYGQICSSVSSGRASLWGRQTKRRAWRSLCFRRWVHKPMITKLSKNIQYVLDFIRIFENWDTNLHCLKMWEIPGAGTCRCTSDPVCSGTVAGSWSRRPRFAEPPGHGEAGPRIFKSPRMFNLLCSCVYFLTDTDFELLFWDIEIF